MAKASSTLLNISDKIMLLDDIKQPSNELNDPISNLSLRRFQMTMVGFWIILSMVGICTNVLNLRAFLRMGLEDSVTISFFVLAISDFDICGIAFVELQAFLCNVLQKEFNLWFYIPPLVPTFYFMCVRRIFNTTTILITTFLALQRCLCVVLPFHVRGMFTKSRTLIFMATIFSASIICYSLFIWRHRVTQIKNQEWNVTQLIIYVPPGSGPYLLLMEVVLGIGLNIVCQSIVMVCLVVMGVFLNKSLQFRRAAISATKTQDDDRQGNLVQSKTVEKTSSKETQAMIQVALVSTIFIVTNSPYLGFGVTNLLIPEFGLHQALNNMYELVHNLMFTAEILNSSVNFVVYYKYNTKFRKCCFQQLKK